MSSGFWQGLHLATETAVAASSRHVGGEVEVKELVVKRSAIGDVRRRCEADGKDLA